MIELLNCDCMEFMKGCEDKKYDLAIVDPPYGLGASVVNSGGRFKRYFNDNGNWDNAVPDDDYFKELIRVSKNQIVWGGNYFDLPPTKCFLIWDKKQPQGISFASCEFAWSSFNYVAKTFYLSPQGQEDRFHPTQKPVKLYEWILKNYAKEGDKILDTHGGSFSHAIAAYNLGFDLDIMELDREYYEAGKKRYEAHVAKYAPVSDIVTTSKGEYKLF